MFYEFSTFSIIYLRKSSTFKSLYSALFNSSSSHKVIKDALVLVAYSLINFWLSSFLSSSSSSSVFSTSISIGGAFADSFSLRNSDSYFSRDLFVIESNLILFSSSFTFNSSSSTFLSAGFLITETVSFSSF